MLPPNHKHGKHSPLTNPAGTENIQDYLAISAAIKFPKSAQELRGTNFRNSHPIPVEGQWGQRSKCSTFVESEHLSEKSAGGRGLGRKNIHIKQLFSRIDPTPLLR